MSLSGVQGNDDDAIVGGFVDTVVVVVVEEVVEEEVGIVEGRFDEELLLEDEGGWRIMRVRRGGGSK